MKDCCEMCCPAGIVCNYPECPKCHTSPVKNEIIREKWLADDVWHKLSPQDNERVIAFISQTLQNKQEEIIKKLDGLKRDETFYADHDRIQSLVTQANIERNIVLTEAINIIKNT